MVDLGAAMAYSAGAILLLMLIVFAISVPIRDVSIVDIAWGLAFALVGVVSFFATSASKERVLTVVLVGVWGLRLATYIAVRKATHPGEDPRYTAMRERTGNFVAVSLYKVFLLQGVLVWLVSLPLFGSAASTDGLGALAYAGAALWLVGFYFEAVGDLQMSRYKSNPRNKGTVMDTGLWRYTRHPNYFGDFCVWWGLYAIALDGGAWWALPSPVIMTVLLMRVSGKGLLEKAMADRPGYPEYVARTSGFFPMPPK